MKITEKEFNALTGEETFTERNETTYELESRLKAEAEIAERQAEVQALEEAKLSAQAKLAALGLTVEDLTALGL